ncbi:VOC family protein [Qingshengfaniella alkalisoli]|uniref:VOC family protein n=1 Tax=Qingshengfaniella alkalisoli TaxID=2599296 RepID=A0A5B8IZ23_9RHOB|nr:VOC family protein [Qingshengfaniella alkalisoli]QDY70823.1 VOC family protein [Qingshengfaniella alkalisoli]
MSEHPVKSLDHTLILVNDLSHAYEQYKALGFNVSPIGIQGKAKGSANHTIMLQDDYIELLGIVEPTPLNADRRAALAHHGEGLHGLAMRVSNAKEAVDDLAKRGVKTTIYNEFSRPVALPDGTIEPASFATLLFEPSQVPVGIAFMCEHKTPHLVWRDELTTHPNSAVGVLEVVAISDNTEADGQRYQRLFGFTTDPQPDGSVVLRPPAMGGTIRLLPSTQAHDNHPATNPGAGRYIRLRVAVRSLTDVTRCLEDSSVPYTRSERCIIVEPEYAAGVTVEFLPI